VANGAGQELNLKATAAGADVGFRTVEYYIGLGEDFHYGAVLHTGTIPFEIDDRIWAPRLSCLWRQPT